MIPGKDAPDKNGNKNEIGKKMPFGEVRYESFKHNSSFRLLERNITNLDISEHIISYFSNF